MRSLIILGAFALAACASSNQPASSPQSQSPNTAIQDPKPQSPNDPIANNHPLPQDSTMKEPAPQQPQFNDPKPQASQFKVADNQALAKSDKPMTDGEVLKVLIAANDGEVEMADVAIKKASQDDVKQFATMMKTHHTQGGAKAKALQTKAKITPADSDVSSLLKSEVDDTMKDLRDKDGKSFDKAYVESQVKAHKDVLSAIDNRLVPSAKNGELKSMVTETRRVVADHLSRAEDLQKKLDTRTSSL